MLRFFCFFCLLMIVSCSHVTYYVVRHAEKEQASGDSVMFTPGDPPLSVAGQERAIALRDELRGNRIRHIFSTNTLRTVSTAQPFNELRGATKIEFYNSKDSLDYFIQKLKAIKKGNSLIVGHSNTVDDIINKLCGSIKIQGDLPDSEYDNLYIVTRKGKKIKFENKTYGVPTN